MFRYQSQVTLLSTGWFLHLLIATNSPAVPYEDPAHWCGGSEWEKCRITSSCDFSFSPVSLTRAVHGNFSLVLGNCPGLAAHPTHPPS